MSRHSNGKMNWKIADEVKEGLRMRLVGGAVGLVILTVVIVIMETTGIGGR